MENKKQIIWASSHNMTDAQKKELSEKYEIVELKDVNSDLLEAMKDIKMHDDLRKIARDLIDLAVRFRADIAQPAGPPAFQYVLGQEIMKYLEHKDKNNLPRVLFAYSKREIIEKKNDSGAVVKTSIFRHLGFVELWLD